MTKKTTTNGLTEAVGVLSELSQKVRRAAWFYFWLQKEFLGTDADIRFHPEYETLHVLSVQNPHTRMHIRYDGRAVSVSYWNNFKELRGLEERYQRLDQDIDEAEYANDEAALVFVIKSIRELML